jgi:hypothetical protein
LFGGIEEEKRGEEKKSRCGALAWERFYRVIQAVSFSGDGRTSKLIEEFSTLHLVP